MASSYPTKKKGAGINFVLPTSGLDTPGDAATEGATAPSQPAPIVPRAAPRTGVGLLTTTVFETNKLEGRIEELESEVERLAGERGAQRLDPRSIAPSRWANRHPDAFSGEAFDALKREILDAGGNVQPIKVRPISGRKADDDAVKYEVVFGHRRHRACLELGLPVLAVVAELDDSLLFVEMERENRGRESLSAWEQGRMYLRAIEEKLFPSATKLGAAIGRSVSDIGKAMRIAKLPQEVTSAFPSPNSIQFRWATDLERALNEHQEAVLAAAREIGKQGGLVPAADVFTRLTACLRTPPSELALPPSRSVQLPSGQAALLSVDGKGRTVIQLPPDVFPPEKWDDLARAIRQLIE